MHVHEASGAFARATAGIDAIEVRMTVVAQAHARALAVLGLRPQDALWRRLFFYDTPTLELQACGVMLRGRATAGAVDDSTVKIRPIDPDRLERWRGARGFKVEAELVAGTVIRSASFTAELRGDEIEAAARGQRRIARLFSLAQEEFLRARAPMTVDFSRLVSLGPVHARRWWVRHPGLTPGIRAEAWRMPDGRSLLELSIKVEPAEVAASSRRFAGLLRELGIATCDEPQTKTRAALTALAALSQG